MKPPLNCIILLLRHKLYKHLHFNNKVIYFIAYFIIPLRIRPLIKLKVYVNSYRKSLVILPFGQVIKYKLIQSHCWLTKYNPFIKIQPGHNADPLVIFSSSGCLQFWLSTNALTASAIALRCLVHHTDIYLIISFQPI